MKKYFIVIAIIIYLTFLFIISNNVKKFEEGYKATTTSTSTIVSTPTAPKGTSYGTPESKSSSEASKAARVARMKEAINKAEQDRLIKEQATKKPVAKTTTLKAPVATTTTKVDAQKDKLTRLRANVKDGAPVVKLTKKATATPARKPIVVKKAPVVYTTVKKAYHYSNCDEMIRVYRPAILPASAPVKCVDSIPGGQWITAQTSVTVYSESHFSPNSIIIKRGFPLDVMKAAYVHEAYHWESFSWSKEKQAAYLSFVGRKTWTGGSYTRQAAEMWAGSGANCAGFHQSTPYSRVPGGCATITKWTSN